MRWHRDKATIKTSWQSHWLISPHQRCHWVSVWRSSDCQCGIKHSAWEGPILSQLLPVTSESLPGVEGKQVPENRLMGHTVKLSNWQNYSMCVHRFTCVASDALRYILMMRVQTTQLISGASAEGNSSRQRWIERGRCCQKQSMLQRKLSELLWLLSCLPCMLLQYYGAAKKTCYQRLSLFFFVFDKFKLLPGIKGQRWQEVVGFVWINPMVAIFCSTVCSCQCQTPGSLFKKVWLNKKLR